MLPVDADTIRLFLHVLAATIWVGGQLTLAGLVPALRAAHPEATRTAAQAYNRLAWPAFAVLIGTGIWNILAVNDEPDSNAHSAAYRTTLAVKLVIVAVSGLAAFAHTRAKSSTGLAIFGALTGLSALAALFLGVLLAG